ncbi:MAG: dTMP kinase [Treponema sp.]|jgi:dTMP kinase|nr:dTMP kinase [Treponema sp.]
MDIIRNFVVLEGGDGSGTTTQLAMLTERLKNTQKLPFFPTFEPTDGKIGLIIRAALKKEIILNPETICFLFAADRNEHLYEKDGIIERAARGGLVISDRYFLSSLVYQGIECGDELPEIANSRFPAPEITIFFDIKPEIAIERIKSRPSREIYEHLDFQKKVHEKYLSVLKNFTEKGGRVEIIDASEEASKIADKVWSIISQMPIFIQSESFL